MNYKVVCLGNARWIHINMTVRSNGSIHTCTFISYNIYILKHCIGNIQLMASKTDKP